LVFIYIFAAYWVRVKLHGAKTHRAAQRVPGWRVVARPRVTCIPSPRFCYKGCNCFDIWFDLIWFVVLNATFSNPKVTSVYFYQLTWGNVSTNSLVFLYIFAAYWVRVKLHGAQTHRAAQRVPNEGRDESTEPTIFDCHSKSIESWVRTKI
jgi:hypothetical protein